MFSIGSKNFIPQIQAIHSLVSEWVQAPENERDLLWRKILETISPLVYGFPRFRFGENEDTCSEFYLFALDFIPQILEYSVRKESGFPFYFAKSLRTLYYKFCRKEKKKSQEKVRMNYEHEILSHGPWTNSGSEGWDNFLHQRMEKKISTDEGYGALETTAENNKISEILHGILCSMPIKQRSIIKLQFGLQLGQDEVNILRQSRRL
jgi:DNA-directed RNA polymerase specialized sigma24 family protein